MHPPHVTGQHLARLDPALTMLDTPLHVGDSARYCSALTLPATVQSRTGTLESSRCAVSHSVSTKSPVPTPGGLSVTVVPNPFVATDTYSSAIVRSACPVRSAHQLARPQDGIRVSDDLEHGVRQLMQRNQHTPARAVVGQFETLRDP